MDCIRLLKVSVSQQALIVCCIPGSVLGVGDPKKGKSLLRISQSNGVDNMQTTVFNQGNIQDKLR